MSARIVKITTPAGEFIGSLKDHPDRKDLFILKDAVRISTSPSQQPGMINIILHKLDKEKNFKPDIYVSWHMALIMDLDESGEFYRLYKNGC